jgi:hypothetical protein
MELSFQSWGEVQEKMSCVSINTSLPERAVSIKDAVSGNNLA